MYSPGSALFLFYPLLLERSYGGGGEVIWLLIQGLAPSLMMTICAVAVVKLSSQVDEAYGARYRRFLKKAGIVVVLFAVVYALASL